MKSLAPHILTRLCAVLVTLLIALPTARAESTISFESAYLDYLRTSIEESADSGLEMTYIYAFPASFEDFRFAFYGTARSGELSLKYDEHLALLNRLSQKYPEQVLSLWLSIASDATADSNAVSLLHSQLIAFAQTRTALFARALLTRSPVERRNISRFLVDVDSVHPFEELDTIIAKLDRMGYSAIAEHLSAARTERQVWQLP